MIGRRVVSMLLSLCGNVLQYKPRLLIIDTNVIQGRPFFCLAILNIINGSSPSEGFWIFYVRIVAVTRHCSWWIWELAWSTQHLGIMMLQWLSLPSSSPSHDLNKNRTPTHGHSKPSKCCEQNWQNCLHLNLYSTKPNQKTGITMKIWILFD